MRLEKESEEAVQNHCIDVKGNVDVGDDKDTFHHAKAYKFKFHLLWVKLD